MKKMSRRGFAQALAGLSASSLPAAAEAPKSLQSAHGSTTFAAGLKVAAFSCDITPPIGSPLEECHPPIATSVESPLLAKGIILSDGRTRYCLCAFDYCEIHTGAHDLFRRGIANALGVNELQVEVHCIHQHDAPIYDSDAEMLLDLMPSPPHITDLDFLKSAAQRVSSAVREALDRLEPCTHVGCGKAKVEKVASNRRVPMPNGSIGVRYSSCTDPVLIAAPEGLIDPWLRTITIFDRQRPLARLHYYASHPISHYGQGHMTPDFPGLAREQLEKEEGVPQIYFTGCGGNIGAGKYNDGSTEARVQLTERMYQGMKRAIAATRKELCSDISWKTDEVQFALRTEPDFSESRLREVLRDPNQPYGERTKAVLALAWYNRVKVRPTVDVSFYRLGPARILHLPGECFVEYQLYAQSLRPDDFIAVAAYGELGPVYIVTDKAITESGYEPTDSFVGPPSERLLKDAIARLLADQRRG